MTQPLTSVARYDTLHLGVARYGRRLMNEQELVSLLHAHKWSLNKRKNKLQGNSPDVGAATEWLHLERTEHSVA